MKLAITALLLLLPQLAFTQNCPDFDRLMKEGDAARDYEVAFNKYDSADAVACSEADRNKARSKKSELFKKINKLREKAEAAEAEARRSAQLAEDAAQKIKEEQQKTLAERNTAREALRLNELMSDSVAQATEQMQQANQSVSTLIRMNDLEELGNIALKKEDYATALKYFTDVQQMLGRVAGQDSLLFAKSELIAERIVQLKEQWSRVQHFEALLSEGDSLKNLGLPGLSAAFDRYLAAADFNLKRDLVLAGLTSGEIKLRDQWKLANRLSSEKYLDLMVKSTQAFYFSGNQAGYQSRIRSIALHPDIDPNWIENQQVRTLVKNIQGSFWRRVSIYAGVRYRFGRQSSKPILKATLGPRLQAYSSRSTMVKVAKLKADLESNIDAAVNFRLSDKISIGVGLNHRQYLDQYFYSEFGDIYLSNLMLDNGAGAGYYTEFYEKILYSHPESYYETKTNYYVNLYIDVLKYFQRRGPFGVQLSTGLEYNINEDIKGNISFANAQTPQSIENISYDVTFASPFSIYVANYSSNYLRVDLKGDYYDSYRIRELELNLGLRFTFEPFRMFRNIGIFSEVSYRQSLPGLFKPRTRFNLADEAIAGFPYSQYASVPQEDIDQFLEQLKNFYDVDISIDSRRRQMLYAWNINTGIYYRF